MAQRFKDQVVWITGAGSGIGRALAHQLADEGAIVVVSGRRAEKLDEVVAAIEAQGGRARAAVCDVTDTATLEAAVANILQTEGRLDVSVANAGWGAGGTIEKLDEDTWRRQFDTNVIGAVMTVKTSLPALKESRGRVVLIGSVAAFTPYPMGGAYASSKAAVAAIGEVLSLELTGSGVSCTTIHPGFVESEIAQVDNRGVHRANRPDPRPMNLMWPADKAARVMAGAIARRKRVFVFTGHGKVGVFMGRHFPGIVHAALKRGAGPKPPAKA